MDKYVIVFIALISCNLAPKTPPIQIKVVSELGSRSVIPEKDLSCPNGMVHIVGKYCNYSNVCLEWLDKKRCKKFAEKSTCSGPEKQLDFCMDVEEYNKDGYPLTFITYNIANSICKKENKRLCDEEEFVLSCGGNDRLPYPYGYERNDYCNIDHKAYIKNDKLVNESNPIWENTECMSPFGIHNLTGNVDEWYKSSGGTKYSSTLHGGFWGYIRGRCEMSSRTTEHNFLYSDTQTGFRCCSNIK